MNTATTSFNTTVRQTTKMPQQQNDRNVSVKKKNRNLKYLYLFTARYGL